MKKNLFDCKVGDKVVYTVEGLTGIITQINSRRFTVVWSITDEEEGDCNTEQEISIGIYKGNNAWQKVIQYEDEKELLMLMIKYSPS
jgi:hypothetical protein